jgi:hypothetical protein
MYQINLQVFNNILIIAQIYNFMGIPILTILQIYFQTWLIPQVPIEGPDVRMYQINLQVFNNILIIAQIDKFMGIIQKILLHCNTHALKRILAVALTCYKILVLTHFSTYKISHCHED